MSTYTQLLSKKSSTQDSPTRHEKKHTPPSPRKETPKKRTGVETKVTRTRDKVRDRSREGSRDKSREKLRELPTRDEVQEFSFRLRDELRVKIQAEVPPSWQGELEEISRKLNVKKLELYRFIIGEFLGKVHRKQ